jgi:ATP-dependent DNA helicase RecG
LLTAAEDDSIALQRIEAVAGESDGFKLSEIDLELRREGDVLGANQSGGRSSLRLLQVIRDAALIQKVRVEVEELFEKDPELETFPNLRLAIEATTAVENLSKG